MARLKLSASGLRSPLDVPNADVDRAPAAEPQPVAPDPAPAPARTVDEAIAIDAGLVSPRELSDLEDLASAPAEGPAVEDPSTDAPAETVAAPASAPAPTSPPAAAPTATTPAGATVDTTDLPAWAAALDVASLAPARLLGRPKQTALILDRGLSSRADELVAATGPRVTFAAIVTAILHFHLPADGDAAARTIGGYRRRRLDALDHPWEERNARLPEPLRAELDDGVAGATGRVASVHRSTLVNALLDAHLPEGPDEAARLVTRMEMVRGGAFLEYVD
jgi:hypothetical protein